MEYLAHYNPQCYPRHRHWLYHSQVSGSWICSSWRLARDLLHARPRELCYPRSCCWLRALQGLVQAADNWHRPCSWSSHHPINLRDLYNSRNLQLNRRVVHFLDLDHWNKHLMWCGSIFHARLACHACYVLYWSLSGNSCMFAAR